MNEWLYFLGATFISGVLTWATKQFCLRRGLLDVPNARSSHSAPTPRGGGLAIALTTLAGSVALIFADRLPFFEASTLVCTGGLIAAVGYIDDRISLSALSRFSVHLLCAAISVVVILSGSQHAPLAGGLIAITMSIIWCLTISWSVNLFNFMDGIDGLAGSQAVFVMGSSAILIMMSNAPEIAVLPVLTAGACLGFLIWNWPRAKIFMGDVGSGFLGFWLASTALLLATIGALNPWTSLILNSVFVADATATLARRLLSGQRWYEAHRSHAYQHLSRRWNSHKSVTMLLWKLNFGAVLPIAVIASLYPSAASALALGTVVLLGILAIIVGAGSDSTHGATPDSSSSGCMNLPR